MEVYNKRFANGNDSGKNGRVLMERGKFPYSKCSDERLHFIFCVSISILTWSNRNTGSAIKKANSREKYPGKNVGVERDHCHNTSIQNWNYIVTTAVVLTEEVANIFNISECVKL